MSKLSQITSVYKGLHKGETAAAVIQNGTLDNEKSAVGTIDNIEELVKDNNLGSPAIIVIGDVVSASVHMSQLNHRLSHSLAS